MVYAFFRRVLNELNKRSTDPVYFDLTHITVTHMELALNDHGALWSFGFFTRPQGERTGRACRNNVTRLQRLGRKLQQPLTEGLLVTGQLEHEERVRRLQ